MNYFAFTLKRAMLASLCFAPAWALAFNSGSTGADGAFNPTVNTVVQLPDSGVFNFTTVNIPAGVTVTFKKNTTNTPVVMLASGNVTIAGALSVSGGHAAHVGSAGDGNIGDDGVPGMGGPGGYDGGRGGQTSASRRGGTGLGPGGGDGGSYSTNSSFTYAYGGAGGGFGGSGAGNYVSTSYSWGSLQGNVTATTGGPVYGSSLLLPLIGGSGGGGGAGGTTFGGSGGGGGGGAILIASTGTVNVTGAITAYGGWGGQSDGAGGGGVGGGGSGGAVRIVATTIAGNGKIEATGGGGNSYAPSSNQNGGAGGNGRIRLESESITRTAATSPAYTFGAPGSLFIAGAPSLTISSVGGVAAPAAPTGNADITLPANTPNPVTIVFATTGVPVGNTIKLTVTPTNAAPIVVVSPALTGSTDNATASVSVTLPSGPSVLSATTTYTIVAALGDLMSTYAQGERVEKITLAATLGGASRMKLITVSGKEYDAPAAALALAGING